MDNQAFDLLKERLDRMENKIDELLEFKWKIIGGAFVLGMIGSGVFEVIKIVVG